MMRRVYAAAAALLLGGLVLACAGVAGLPAVSSPRWACPSPTPLPYGEAGPVKHEDCTIDPVTGERTCTRAYYQQWEQEYGQMGGPPFPAPTPYVVQGTSFLLGQRVQVGPLHVMVNARSGPVADLPGIPSGTQQLYVVDITWYNHTPDPIPLDVGLVRLRAITTPTGRIVTDAWTSSDSALDLAGSADLPTAIPPGESQITVPILAPIGRVKTIELAFVGQPGAGPTLAVGASSPTPTPLRDADLRDPAPVGLAVQWTDTTLSIGPGCADPGAMTPIDAGGWGDEVPIAVAAPAGASRVVQIALNQVGKRYVWGAKGPETFDCSGLLTWSYAQIGLGIPQGTAGQWPGMTPVAHGELQPGDLIFFAVATHGQIDHVGMLIGDIDGDGTWDMVHASAPCCGVRVEHNVLGQRFWAPKIVGFRTARGEG